MTKSQALVSLEVFLTIIIIATIIIKYMPITFPQPNPLDDSQNLSSSNLGNSTDTNMVTKLTVGQVTDANLFTTTSTTYVDVTNMSLTFSLSRTSNVLIGGGAGGFNTHATNPAQLTVEVDGATVGSIMPLVNATGGASSASTTQIVSLGVGSHTVKMRLLANTAGTATLPAASQKIIYYTVLAN
jgi:hypothetical protein